MNIDFQQNMLQALIQLPRVKRHIETIDGKVFSNPSDRFIFSALQQYTEKYNSQPDCANLLEYVDVELASKKVDQSTMDVIRNNVKGYYKPIEFDTDFVCDRIIAESQKQMSIHLVRDFSKRLDTPDDMVYDDMLEMITRIAKLDEMVDFNPPLDYTQVFEDVALNQSIGTECFINGINTQKAAHGFLSPELVVILKGPKAFGTGLLINFAYNFWVNGLNVFYVDMENGETQIINRITQRIAEITRDELMSGGFAPDIKNTVEYLNTHGAGKLYVKKFNARSDRMYAIENAIDYLKETTGFVPDVIIYDYIDLLDAPPRDRHHIIQHNYHAAINLNKKYGCFAFTISKSKQSAFDKAQFDLTDFGDDSEKIYNCHSAFGLSRDDVESYAGLARIYPIVQREGISLGQEKWHPVYLKMDMERQKVIELNRADYQSEYASAAMMVEARNNLGDVTVFNNLNDK